MRTLALNPYDRTTELELADVAVDGRITRTLYGRQMAGRSPVDRGKVGLKRCQLFDARGIPIITVPARQPARPPTTPATLDALKDVEPLPQVVIVHLDISYNYKPRRTGLDQRGLRWSTSKRGTPIQIGRRWIVEVINSWTNDFSKSSRYTERQECAVQVYLNLAATIVTVRALLGRA